MGSEWTTIGAISQVIDGPHATPKKIDEGPYFLSISSLEAGKLDLEKSARISDEQFENWTKRVTPEEGDLLFSYETRLGEAALMPGGIKACLGRRMGLLRPDRTKVDPRYFLFAYLGPEFQQEIRTRTNYGATVERISLKELPDFPIQLPPLNEQKAIAHILGTLDDKIELNRRMNATLEGMAQALFKSWFVDFDPVIDNVLAAGNPIPNELAPRAEVRRQLSAKDLPKEEALASSGELGRTNGTTQQGSVDHPTLSDPKSLFPATFQFTEELGWIPEGWEPTTLGELLEVKYGKDHKKLADGKFPVYGSGGLMRHAEAALYKGESVLIPRKGTLNNILYLNEEFWTVDTMFFTVPKRGSVAKFCYYYLKSLDLTSMNVGSAVPSMTTKVLNSLSVVSASDHVLNEFDRILGSYFTKSAHNNRESQTLSELRDTLLPKLISGEMRVHEVEELGKEVAE